MAVTAAELQVVVDADTKGAEKGIGKVTGALGGLGKAATSPIGAIGGLIGGIGKLATGAGLAVFGAQQLSGAIGGFVSSAFAGQEAFAQTEAVIRSTGGAAGMTAQSIVGLADSLEKTTRFSAESVQEGENLLLTFTNIGKDVFPQATKTMLDMAQALGTDASGSAIQLGKALNNPVEGISALTRVGVTFTEGQKETIKAMVAAGDVAGAQGVILQELQKEFGGSAEAAGKTLPGQLDILRNRFGNLKETIAMAAVPALSALATKALPIVERAVDALARNIPRVTDVLGKLADRVSGPLGEAFGLARDGLLTFIQALRGDWSDDDKIHPLHRAIGMIGSVIHDTVIPAIRGFVGFLTGTVIPAVVEFATTAIGYFRDQILPVISDFATGVAGFFTSTVLPAAQQLLDWLGPKITDLAGWFRDTALPAVRDFATQAATFFTGTVLPAVQGFIDAALPKLQQFGDWLTVTAIPAITSFATTVATFITGSVIPALQGFWTAVQPGLQAFADFLNSNLKYVFVGVAAIIVAGFTAWAISAGAAAVTTIAALAPFIAIMAAIGVAAALLYAAWDTNFLGIKDATLAVVDWLKEYVPPVVQAVWDAIKVGLDWLTTAWGTVWPAIQQTIETVMPIVSEVVTTYIGLVKKEIELAIGVIQTVWNTAWPLIQGTIETVWPVITGIVTTAVELVKSTIDTAMNAAGGVAEIWSTAWGVVKGTADTIWNVGTSIVKIIQDGIDAVKGAIDTVLNGPLGIVSIWDTAWGSISGTVSTVAGEIKGFVNDIITAINGLIGAWNGLGFTFGGADTPFGDIPGFTISTPDVPMIPMLAKGGIVTRPTLAMVGERGPEAVVPLDRYRRGNWGGGMGGSDLVGATVKVQLRPGVELDAYVVEVIQSHDGERAIDSMMTRSAALSYSGLPS